MKNSLKYIILFASFAFIACQAVTKIDTPLTPQEITFFEKIDGHPIGIDSIERTIEKERCRLHPKIYISYVIYTQTDTLWKNDASPLCKQISGFVKTLEIENLRFENCSIYLSPEGRPNDALMYNYKYDRKTETWEETLPYWFETRESFPSR